MTTSVNFDKGIKYDEGKLRIDLIPPEVIEALAMVFSYGAKKYEERNWEKGMGVSRLWAATQRHLWSWWGGKNKDEESGYDLASIAMLVTLRQRGMGKDDRA
jgi:hypothetical protein